MKKPKKSGKKAAEEVIAASREKPIKSPKPAPGKYLDENAQEKEPAVGYIHSAGLPEFFRALNCSLMVTTYQAQRILAFSSTGERLSMLMRIFERPTGLSIDGARMGLVCKNIVWYFSAPNDITSETGEALPYDRCFVPRMSYVTGDIAGHECAWFGNELIVVNTRFSCLCRTSPDWSFLPVWKPKFISKIAPEDRCHLNGMAVFDNAVRYLTALGETDTKEGWRDNKKDGGVIIEARSGEVMSRKLSMPHSPRIYRDRLWVLESGRGELQVVDPASGVREVVCKLQGYLRGLAFYDRFAFVGTCKIREKDIFGGLPISEQHEELKCGIFVIDITNGQTVGFLEFTKGIEELFDVQILPGVISPHVLGFEEDTIDGLYTLPPGMLN